MKPSQRSLELAKQVLEQNLPVFLQGTARFDETMEAVALALDSQNKQIEDSRKELIEEIIEKIEKDWYYNGIPNPEDVSYFIKEHFKGSND